MASLVAMACMVALFFRLPCKIKAGVDADRLERHYNLFLTLAEFTGAKILQAFEASRDTEPHNRIGTSH